MAERCPVAVLLVSPFLGFEQRQVRQTRQMVFDGDPEEPVARFEVPVQRRLADTGLWADRMYLTPRCPVRVKRVRAARTMDSRRYAADARRWFPPGADEITGAGGPYWSLTA